MREMFPVPARRRRRGGRAGVPRPLGGDRQNGEHRADGHRVRRLSIWAVRHLVLAQQRGDRGVHAAGVRAAAQPAHRRAVPEDRQNAEA
eukprot:8003265-Pyramimonas_sp.AAC.1